MRSTCKTINRFIHPRNLTDESIERRAPHPFKRRELFDYCLSLLSNDFLNSTTLLYRSIFLAHVFKILAHERRL